jgi:hypothetical protein
MEVAYTGMVNKILFIVTIVRNQLKLQQKVVNYINYGYPRNGLAQNYLCELAVKYIHKTHEVFIPICRKMYIKILKWRQLLVGITLSGHMLHYLHFLHSTFLICLNFSNQQA